MFFESEVKKVAEINPKVKEALQVLEKVIEDVFEEIGEEHELVLMSTDRAVPLYYSVDGKEVTDLDLPRKVMLIMRKIRKRFS